MYYLKPGRKTNISYSFDYTNCVRGNYDMKDVSSLVTRSQHVVVDDTLPSHPALLTNWVRRNPALVLEQSDSPHGSPGNVVTYTTEPVPLLPPESFSFTKKTPGTKKAFDAAIKAGRIVLKPLTLSSMKVQDAPLFARTHSITDTAVRIGVNSPPFPNSCPDYLGVYSGCQGYPTSRRAINADTWGKKYGTLHCSVIMELCEGTASSYFAGHGRPRLEELHDYIMSLEVNPLLRNQALDENYGGLWDLSTELAELPETIKYLYGLLRRIIRIFIGVKSREAAARKKFKGKELTDELSSLWMQFRYAISPIAYSVNDSLEYINDARNRVFISTRKRSDGEHTFTDSAGYTYDFVMESRCFVKSSSDQSKITANLGLNPLKTLWEVTPLAFVVGWILPIGEMLGGLLPPSHLSQVALMESKTVRSVKVKHLDNAFSSDISLYHAETAAAIPNPPFPDVFISWKRMVDALALSWGLFIRNRIK